MELFKWNFRFACAGANSAAQYVRYAQSITLNIELQPDSGNGGLIYPPYLSIYYNWVSKADINSSTTVSFWLHKKIASEHWFVTL